MAFPEGSGLFKKVLNIAPTDAAALYALGELSEEKEMITMQSGIIWQLPTVSPKTAKKTNCSKFMKKYWPFHLPMCRSGSKLRKYYSRRTEIRAAKEYLNIAGICDDKGDIQKQKNIARK